MRGVLVDSGGRAAAPGRTFLCTAPTWTPQGAPAAELGKSRSISANVGLVTANCYPPRCAVGGCVATHWSHDHTVWAEVAGSVQEAPTAANSASSHSRVCEQVADDETWAAIGKLYALPVRKGGMTFFAKEVPISVGWA